MWEMNEGGIYSELAAADVIVGGGIGEGGTWKAMAAAARR